MLQATRSLPVHHRRLPRIRHPTRYNLAVFLNDLLNYGLAHIRGFSTSA